ncbi:MAG: hypothetical protein M1832_004856 [Thelocarpon impressellum]|nr:MAG: hypothetical protein M1832_004856 [Thelocarpon impressellum]
MTRWFHLGLPRINRSYLSGFEGTPVPLELTRTTRDPGADEAHDVFHRFDGPLGQFLDWTERVRPGDVDRLYLAQARVADLPQPLQDDLPTPEIAKRAGRGDIYGASIWVGVAPTYTPLHRDPNPNLLLQLAGAKAVRLFEPSRGADVFAKVQRRLGRQDSAIFRGDEMMQGEQKRLLEEQVWKLDAAGGPAALGCLEARLGRGEGLFIPKGWWHSVKGVDQGVDQGVTASVSSAAGFHSSLVLTWSKVNWWFR